jgi:hypothetical protein
MALNLLPLCELPKLATRDGYAGANAGFMLPFYGYWYADGKRLSFPNALVPQNQSLTTSAPYKQLEFVKAAGVCINQANS